MKLKLTLLSGIFACIIHANAGDTTHFCLNRWDNTTASWFEFQKNTLVKDATAGVETSIEQNFNFDTGFIQNESKEERIFNSSGDIQEVVNYTWNNTLSSWEDQFRTQYFYSSGDLILEIFQTSDGTWVNNYKIEYTYNSSGLVETSTKYIWDGADWEDFGVIYHSYNSLNQLESDSVVQNGVTELKTTNTYNSSGQLIQQDVFHWDSGLWQAYSRSTKSYNTSGLVSEQIEQMWADTGFRNNNRFTYTYMGTEVDEMIQFAWNGASWQNAFMSTTCSSKALGITEKKESIQIYPNPATDYLKTNYRGDYSIYSVTGELIQKGKVSQGTIGLSGVKPGLYYLQAQEVHSFIKF